MKKDIAKEYIDILLDKSARNIVALDMRGISIMTDFFLICTGTSERHMQGIAREVEKNYKSGHKKGPMISGAGGTGWLLVDCGDVIVHVFKEEEREYYNLEGLWNTAKKIKCG